MRWNWFAGGVAASVLLAGLVFLPDIGLAGKGGGRSGGGGHGGGGHASGHAGGGHASFGRSRGMSHRSATRAGSARTSKGVFASRRRASRHTKNALGSKYSQGAKNQQRLSAPGGQHSLKQLTSNKSLRQASFSKHNAFYNSSRFGNANREGRNSDNRWRDRSGNWYGYRWAGSVFWPYAFGDYFSYAFWPGDYSDSFWGYGPDALLWGTFWPYGEFASDAGNGAGESLGDIYNREPAATAKASAAGVTGLAQTCGGLSPGVSDLPLQSLEKIAGSNEDQRAALQDLKKAAAQASDILRQSCSPETPLTPVARLDAMQHRLQAIEEAGETVRGPLLRFYGLLSDEQKQRLSALATSSARRHPKALSAAGVNIGELCTSQSEFTAVPADEIASTVSLDGAQKQQLDTLKAASVTASDGLKASCPSTIPDTVDGRLDAAQKRVAALIVAVTTIRPAVRDFFGSLTDEQKAALNIQAETPRKSADKG